MTEPKVTAKIQLEGKFFTRSPGKTLRGNVMDMLDEIAKWAESEVNAGIESHRGEMPYYTGWTKEHDKGHTSSWTSGGRWSTWAAVGTDTRGMDAKDARRTKAAAATIERRWHPWRKVKQGVYRSRPVIQAALAKDMN